MEFPYKEVCQTISTQSATLPPAPLFNAYISGGLRLTPQLRSIQLSAPAYDGRSYCACGESGNKWWNFQLARSWWTIEGRCAKSLKLNAMKTDDFWVIGKNGRP